jgi:hypothetical protein
MKKFSQDDFNRLLKQYKALSVERLEIENEILRSYESLAVENTVTIASISTSDKFKTINSLRERLKILNKEMKKIDKKISKLFKDS